MPDEPKAPAPQPEADDSDEMSLEDVTNLLEGMVGEVEEEDKEPKGEGEPPAEEPEAAPTPTVDATSILQSAEGQQVMRNQFNAWLQEMQSSGQRGAEAAEVQKLIDENNVEELGRRWVEAAQKSKVSGEAIENFLDKTYRDIFADPVFQGLTAEEARELSPDNFKSDSEYIRHLSQFMARKNREGGLEEMVEERLAQRLETLKNQKAGTKAASSSVGAPSADTKAPERTGDSRSLVSEGLREAFKDYIPA